MQDPQIEKLLIVQNRDIALQKIEQELLRIPEERKHLDRLIEEEKINIESARHSLQEKEVQRKELDITVKAREADITRFKNQQLQVKKNEEYRALSQQIEQAEADIARLEEEEIGLMLEIDRTRDDYEREKAAIELRIQEQQMQINELALREQSLRDSIQAAEADLQKARADAETHYLEHYDRVRKLVKRAPYLVPIQQQKCGGCHLRVSNEVSRGALHPGEPHFCDQCARMVYA